MWKGFREFFTYTHRQRNGLLLLAVLALLLNVLIYLDSLWPQPKPEDFSNFERDIAAWEKQQQSKVDSAARELFLFDPNSAEEADLLRLGLNRRQAQSIINYRSKGGRFRKPADLARIYTLDSADFERLRPYIRIEERPSEFAISTKPVLIPGEFDPNRATAAELSQLGLSESEVRGIISYREKFKPFEKASDLLAVYNLDSLRASALLPFVMIDSLPEESRTIEKAPVLVNLNTADTNLLKSLPGIGSVFARRIVKYRDRLGGFHSKEQLLEVYGMDRQRYLGVLPLLILDNSTVRQLNINELGFSELLAHPYLEYEVVQNIVNFRERVRRYQSVEELQHIELIDAHLFSKIAPYLTVDD